MPAPLPFSRGLKNRVLLLGAVPMLYVSWLAMMALHEAGHVLHGWVSGASVFAVRVPLVGFSLTEFSTNPHPHFVAWGGAVWGSVMPVGVWALFRARRWRGWKVLQFFAGFCLVANGTYLGIGWVEGAGDAAGLVRHGTPVWVLVTIGVVTTSGGLLLWHLLGQSPSPEPSPLSTGERG
jgi:hypothetical protein